MYVERDTKPDPVEMTEKMVFINTNIQKMEKEIEGENHSYYSFDQESYTTAEYIDYLQNQLSSTEMALCEIYEEVIS